VGHAAHIGRRREMYTGFDGETEEKRLHGRRRCKWEHNIEMDLT
jgi:hypothetical protein